MSISCSESNHYSEVGESKLGRLVDALALGGDEGRNLATFAVRIT